MTTISDMKQKIFELIRNDADFESDEAAFAEADKRAKQHDRNNQALSLALSESPSPAMDGLLSFLNLEKAPLEIRHTGFPGEAEYDEKTGKTTRSLPEDAKAKFINTSVWEGFEFDDTTGKSVIPVQMTSEEIKDASGADPKVQKFLLGRVKKRAEKNFKKWYTEAWGFEPPLEDIPIFVVQEKGGLTTTKFPWVGVKAEELRSKTPEIPVADLPENSEDRILPEEDSREQWARKQGKPNDMPIDDWLKEREAKGGRKRTAPKTTSRRATSKSSAKPSGEGDAVVQAFGGGREGMKAVYDGVKAKKGINVLRPGRREKTRIGHKHYGNPFYVPRNASKEIVQEAVDKYRAWLNKEMDAPGKNSDAQRDWILEQVDKGKLAGQTLLYYTDEHEENHADALAEFANARMTGGKVPAPKRTTAAPKSKTTRQERKPRATARTKTKISSTEGDLPKIDFQQDKSGDYKVRTVKNVMQSDATLGFEYAQTAGIRATRNAAAANDKPYLALGVPKNLETLRDEDIEDIVEFLNENNVTSINLSGSGIYHKDMPSQDIVDDFTHDVLGRVLNHDSLENKITKARAGGQTGFDEAAIKAARHLGVPDLTVYAPKNNRHRIKGNRGKPSDVEATPEEFAARYNASAINTDSIVAEETGAKPKARTTRRTRRTGRRRETTSREPTDIEGQTPEEIEAIRRQIDPSVEGRERREMPTSPHDYLDEYITSMAESRDLLNINSDVYYYPHLDTFATLSGHLVKTTRTGRGRQKRTKTDGNYGRKSEAKNLIYNPIERLRNLERVERDFLVHKDSGKSNFNLYDWVSKINPGLTTDIKERIDDTIWERFAQGERVTDSDASTLFGIIQDIRVATAEDLARNLQGVSLQDSWRSVVPNVDIRYGEQVARAFKNRGKRRNARDLAKEKVEALAFGSKKLGIMGLSTLMQNSIPEDTNSQAYRDLITVYNLSNRYNLDTYKKIMESAVGSADKHIGITFGQEQLDILQNLSNEVRQAVDNTFLQDPSKYGTEDAFQRLMDDKQEAHDLRLKRASDGAKKQIGFFKDYELPVGISQSPSELEKLAIQRASYIEELDALVEANKLTREEANQELDAWNRERAQKFVAEEATDIGGPEGREYEEEEVVPPGEEEEPPATGVEAQPEDMESQDIQTPEEKEEPDTEENVDFSGTGIEVDGLATSLPEGHTYGTHLTPKFKTEIEGVVNKLFGLSEERIGIRDSKNKPGVYPVAADVYLSDVLAQAYLGVEGHPEIKENTPINIKVRTTTEAGKKQVKDLAKTIKEISGHKVSITSHVGDTPAANDDEHQVMFWHDSLLLDIGDMGTTGVRGDHRVDPFGARPKGKRFQILSDETLRASLPKLRDSGRLQYERTNFKPTEENARQLIGLLPTYQNKYNTIKTKWKSIAIDIDEDGKPILVDTILANAVAERDAFDKTGGGAEKLRAAKRMGMPDLLQNARNTLDNAVSSASERYMHGKIYHIEDKVYKALEAAVDEDGRSIIGTGEFAPEPVKDKNGKRIPNLVRIRGYKDALDIVRKVREEDVQALVTGVDNQGRKLERGSKLRGLKHEFDEDGNSLGIPNILLNIQLRNSGEEAPWETVGHLVPNWKDWFSINTGQMKNRADLEGTHWKVFNTDKGVPLLGHWEDTGIDGEQSWDWDIFGGINPTTGEVMKGHHLAVGAVKGNQIADDYGLEQISHRPGVGLDLISSVSGKTSNQVEYYNKLRSLSATALQIFRPSYARMARIWSKTKMGEYSQHVKKLLRWDVEGPGRAFNVNARTSYSIDNPSIFEIINNEYSTGNRLNTGDYRTLGQYGLALKNAYKKAEEELEEGQEVYLNNLAVDAPTQFVDGEQIPLLSDTDLAAFGRTFLNRFVIMRGQTDEQKEINGAALYRLESVAGDPSQLLDVDNPIFSMVENERKFKNISEYESFIGNANQDLPESFFRGVRDRSEFRTTVYREYPRYRAVAELLGYGESMTPVRTLFHAMNLMEENANGVPIRFSYSLLGKGGKTVGAEALLKEKLDRFAPSKITHTTDDDDNIVTSTEGKDSAAKVLTKNRKGDTVIRDLIISSDNSENVGRIMNQNAIRLNSEEASTLLNNLNIPEIEPGATHEDIQAAIANISKFNREQADSLNSLNEEDLAEFLSNYGMESKDSVLNALRRYDFNLRSLDSGLINIPAEFYKNKSWMTGQAYGEGTMRPSQKYLEAKAQLQEHIGDTAKNLANIQKTFADVEITEPEALLYTQNDYERRYLAEIGRSIGNPRTAEEELTKAFDTMRTIRQRVRDSSRDDFVSMENPEEAANNSINVMLNMLGNIWFRKNSDYLVSEEYYKADIDNPGWWDIGLRDKPSISVRGRREGTEIDVSKRGLLMNLETPVEMWHDDLLFNPANLIVKPKFGEGLELVPRNEDISDIYDPVSESNVGFIQRVGEAWETFTLAGERVYAGAITKAEAENAVRNTPINSGDPSLTVENGEMEVERANTPAENGDLSTNNDQITPWLSGSLLDHMKQNEWSEDVLSTIFDEITAERAENGQNPLDKLTIAHLNENSYNLAQRVADKTEEFQAGTDKPRVQQENSAVITIGTKAQNNKTIKNFRRHVRGVSTSFGLPLADILFKKGVKPGETDDNPSYDKDSALPGWTDLEGFMKEQGLLGEKETLFTTLKSGESKLNAKVVGEQGKFIQALVTGHSVLSDEQNEAAQTFFADTLGLELSDDYIGKRQSYRAGTPIEDTTTRQPIGGRREVQPAISAEDVDLNKIAPPRFSRGAVEALKKAGVPIPDDVITRMKVRNPKNPRTEGAYMDAMYPALPLITEEGKPVGLEQNTNFLGLSSENHNDLILLFGNLLEGEKGNHNYPFDARPMEGKGKNRKGRLTRPATNSPEGFQTKGTVASEFTTADANKFIADVLQGDEESIGNYFQTELMDMEPEEIEDIQQKLGNKEYVPVEPEVPYTPEEPVTDTVDTDGPAGPPSDITTTAAPVDDGQPDEPRFADLSSLRDKYERPFASILETITTGKRKDMKGKEKKVKTLVDAIGNPLEPEVINALFPKVIDSSGKILKEKELLAKLNGLSDAEIEVIRRKSLTDRQRTEELIIIGEKGPEYMDAYIKSPITDELDPTSVRGAISRIKDLPDPELKIEAKLARTKLVATKGEGKSREDYQKEFAAIYNKKHKVDASPAMIDAMSNEDLMAATKKIRDEKIKAEELKAISEYKVAANDLSGITAPESSHPELVKQFARRILMHQQMYDNGEMEAVDDKGEKYLTPETRQQLETYIAWLQQNHPKLLQEVTKEVEDLGEELDDLGRPRTAEKIKEAEKRIEEIKAKDDNYTTYIQEHANESLVGKQGQVLIGQTSEGVPVRMNYDARGIPVGEVDPDAVRESDLQPPHMVGLSAKTKELWNEYHKLSISSKNPEHLQTFVEAEANSAGDGIEGLEAFRDELTKQFSTVLERAETPEEAEVRAKRNMEPKGLLRDWMFVGGVFNPSYWKDLKGDPEEPALLDNEALIAIAAKYKGIPNSVIEELLNDAKETAQKISTFTHPINVSSEMVELTSQFNKDIFSDETKISSEYPAIVGQEQWDSYAVAPYTMGLVQQQAQKELDAINKDLENLEAQPYEPGVKLARRNELIKWKAPAERLLDAINYTWQPAMQDALDSQINNEGFKYIDSQIKSVSENNMVLNMARAGKHSILEQARKYSEMADAKKEELQRALVADGIEGTEAETLIGNLGLTSMERLMQDVDPTTGLPVNEAGEVIQPPAEGLLYSPVLHAWVNPNIIRHIFGQIETDRDLYIANYAELRNQAEGIDQGSPEAQAFTPVVGTKRESPLSKSRDLVFHSKFGWLPLADVNQVREAGEMFSAADLVSAALSSNISRDKTDNKTNYGNAEGIPYTLTGMDIDENLNISSQKPERLPEDAVNKIAPPKEPGVFEQGGPAAQLLAEMRGLSGEVGKQSSFAHNLIMGTKGFMDTPFGLYNTNLGFIIPTTESMRFTDDVYQEMSHQQQVRDTYEKRLYDISGQRTPKEEKLQFKTGDKSITVEQLQIELQREARRRMSEGLPQLTTDVVNQFITENIAEQDLNKPSLQRLKVPIDPELKQPSMSAVDRFTGFVGETFPKAPPTPQEIYEQQVKAAHDQKLKAEGHQKRVAAAGINIPNPDEEV